MVICPVICHAVEETIHYIGNMVLLKFACEEEGKEPDISPNANLQKPEVQFCNSAKTVLQLQCTKWLWMSYWWIVSFCSAGLLFLSILILYNSEGYQSWHHACELPPDPSYITLGIILHPPPANAWWSERFCYLFSQKERGNIFFSSPMHTSWRITIVILLL